MTDEEIAKMKIREALTWMDHFARRHYDGTIENAADEALDALALLGAPSQQLDRVESDNPEQIDIHIIRAYLNDAPRKSITDKQARAVAIASLDRIALLAAEKKQILPMAMLEEIGKKIDWTRWHSANVGDASAIVARYGYTISEED